MKYLMFLMGSLVSLSVQATTVCSTSGGNTYCSTQAGCRENCGYGTDTYKGSTWNSNNNQCTCGALVTGGGTIRLKSK